jgi:hypothetical protein
MPHFARGSRGVLIQKIRKRLHLDDVPHDKNEPNVTEPAFQPFDGPLEKEVIAFETANGIDPQTGRVDEALWDLLFPGKPFPDLFSRAFQVVASIEGHGYSAEITPDGITEDKAGITMGIIGFQVTSGSLTALFTKILEPLDANQRKDLFDRHGLTGQRGAFEELLLIEDAAKRRKKAIDLFLRDKTEKEKKEKRQKKGPKKVQERWLPFFREILTLPQAIGLQDELAKKKYFDPAVIASIENLFASDLGVLLAFSIVVQGGSLTKKTLSGTERERRIERTILRSEIKNGRKNFEARQMSLARGLGFPNRSFVDVTAWGFDDPDAAPPPRSRMLSLAFSGGPDMSALKQFETQAVAQQVIQDVITDDATVARLMKVAKVPLGSGGVPDFSSAFDIANRTDSVRLFTRLDELPLTCLAIGGSINRDPASGRDIIGPKDGPLRLLQLANLFAWNKSSVFELPFVPKLRGLLILFIPSGLPETAIRFQNVIQRIAGQRPLVVGWRGAVTFPGSKGPFCAEVFFKKLKGQKLDELVVQSPEVVIQAWGRACFETFATKVPELWRTDGKTKSPLTACAAISPAQETWLAVPGQPQNDVFMKKV